MAEKRIFLIFVDSFLNFCAANKKWDYSVNFQKDPCKDAHARGENARTCNALPRFKSKSTKIEKMRFSAIFE